MLDQYYKGYSNKRKCRMGFEITGNILCGSFRYEGNKPLECSKRIANALYSPNYTPIDIIYMWEKASFEHWNECMEIEDNFYELLLNFMVMLGVEI